MGIKVNVSGKEASSGVIEPVPSGWYKATISDIELRESKSEKNNGKPMYAVELTISEPEQYEGRKAFTNACLWDGALYTIIGMMKALGFEVNEGELEIPEADELMGLDVMVKLTITPERTVQTDNGPKTYEARNEVKGFKAVGEQEARVVATAGTASSNGTSLLP